ncbi:glycosyltransferase family 2 protein [Noviherbaspirillum massiliense]|nr:glycosyltransferase family A protein [Noviherbaspirillum massiliense]
MRSSPAISVVMPLYNKARYVEQAIASVLSGNALVHELIVVDDGSTDEGPQLVAAVDDPRIRLIRQRNQGVSAARNHGIREATGDYIAFLDADDYWMPGYIQEIAALIRAYPDCGMFATRYVLFDEEGHTELAPVRALKSSQPQQRITRFFEAWAKGNFFFTSSVVVPRSIFFDHGIFFPEKENLGEDQDVWFRIAELYPVAYSMQPLAAYRTGSFPSLSKSDSGNELPPFVSRLKKRFDDNRIPLQHRRGVSQVLGTHQLNLASAFLRRNGSRHTVSLLFDRFSIQTPRFWLKIFLLSFLPKPIRLRLLEKH